MTVRSTSTLAILTALGGSLLLAGSALAQTSTAAPTATQRLNRLADDAEAPQARAPQTARVQPAPLTSAVQATSAQARARSVTSSLNAAPADTTLSPRPNALPPLTDAERPRPARPLVRTEDEANVEEIQDRPATAADVAPRPRTQRPSSAAPAPAAEPAPAKPQGPSITLAPGETEPEPIAMPLGYYVRGDKACNSVWPGEGDIAWFTPTSFTLDFGGCEPGQFMQTGPNAWSEEQKCHTELGGDAGGYSVTYEVTAPGEVHRRAVLEIDESVEEDVWKHCETAEVPQEARFKS